MNEIFHVTEEYKELLQEIGSKFKQSQIKAATKVNEEMLKFYFWLGVEIVKLRKNTEKAGAVYRRLSKDLIATFPDVKSFSVTNLKYMQYFYELYSSPQLVDCRKTGIFCIP